MSTKQNRSYSGTNYSDFFQNFKMPGMGIGFDTMMASHQKNMETLNVAQQTASDVFRGLMNLNTQYWKSMFEDANSNSRTMMSQENPEEKMQQHANALKGCADKAWHHSQEVSDMLNQSTSKVAAIYSKRFHECMDEGKEILKSSGASETIKV